MLILGCIFIMFALVSHYDRASSFTRRPHVERFEEGTHEAVSKCPGANIRGTEPAGNENYHPLDYTGNTLTTDCMPRDKITADDLLPKDAANSKWAQVNPAGQGSVGDQNFLSAGFHVGVDTQMSSLKIANYDLRPSPVIEQKQVSPWNQSTVMPDLSIKNLS
jgi:hypothetical protein